ncbi:MAG: c-type cytochrome biogenesis protein CcmI [Rhodobacteraceae bacterium]|nr:c-type cytochrome biogenesis protein CcmI [Paracoccaceae bacterium]
MLFWAMATAMAALVALTLIMALRSGAGAGAADAAAADIAVYRDQLAEAERDLERGTLSPEEAQRLRNEIARRILAADRRAADGGASAGGGRLALPALAICLAAAAALAAYWRIGAPGYPDVPLSARIAAAEANRAARPSQADYLARLPAPALVSPDDPAEAALIERLRRAVAGRPDDLTGQELLAQNEARLGNLRPAAAAQARVVALKGGAATAQDFAALADYLVRAAEGYVSPEAEHAALEAFARDPANGTARFYLGLMEAQTGRPDRAFAVWRDLLESSPPEAPWVPVIRDRIGMLAAAAGVDYTPPEATRGPTAGDVAAAGGMAAGDRAAMIRGMVDGLEARLAAEGGTAEEWAQLLKALGVLGETERARRIWQEAQGVFAADPAALQTVAAAARGAGVAE